MILGTFEVMHGYISQNKCGTERADFSEIFAANELKVNFIHISYSALKSNKK